MLEEKTLTEGLILYQVLEYAQRYGLQLEHSADLDFTIRQQFHTMKQCFERTWAEHTCETPRCGEVLVFDADMKLTRPICAAKTGGIVELQHSPGTVVTGCREFPPIGQTFCKDHAEGTTTPTKSEQV